jgi:predicted metalloprotease with PDZ domain
MTAAKFASVHYRVEAADLHAHLFRITLSIAQPAAQQTVSLPVWIPGSYLVREFSKNLQKLSARQDGRAVAVQQLDKCTWQADCAPGRALVVTYEVYAFDNSVRTAWLDTQRGFFNATSVCLRVHGQEHMVHSLELAPVEAKPGWKAASGRAADRKNKRGVGV